MNHNRKPMDSRARKKNSKAIKKGQQALENQADELRTDELTTKDALKKYPKKKAIVDATVKGMKTKKKKAESHASKRTGPGETDNYEFTPKGAQTEGKRWKQVVDKQNQMKRKSLTAKLRKNSQKKTSK